MVSLPSRWVKLNNVKKGDEVDVDEQGKKILISIDKERESECVEIDGRQTSIPFLSKYISCAYKAGYDETRIYIDDPLIAENVQSIVQKYFIGYEVIKQSRDSISLKSVTGDTDVEFDSTLRRIFLLLLTMARESLAGTKNNDVNYLRSVKLLELSNDRFTNYCRRILNMKGYKDHKKTIFLYVIIEQLEKIADEFNYLIKNYHSDKKKVHLLSKELLDFYSDTVKILELYYDLFYNLDKRKIVVFEELKSKLIDEGNILLKNKNENDAIAAHHLICITQRVHDVLASTIAFHMDSKKIF